MTTEQVVRLGQEAFFLSPGGEVVHTKVARIDENNEYSFLNGHFGSFLKHWFSFEEAVAAADAYFALRQAVLRKELRALSKKRHELQGTDYRDDVTNSLYKVVDPRDPIGFTSSRPRARDLIDISVPETYFTPGQMLYAVITPEVRPRPHHTVYQPRQHFVLEVRVTGVCFTPDGRVHYTFSTPFIIEEFFRSKEEAETKIRGACDLGSTDSVFFVSNVEERAEIKKILDAEDDIPF